MLPLKKYMRQRRRTENFFKKMKKKKDFPHGLGKRINWIGIYWFKKKRRAVP